MSVATSHEAAAASMPHARQLAAYFSGASFRNSPREHLEAVKTYVLDTLAVALAGSIAESSRIVVRAVLRHAGRGASVFGTGRAASPGEAALVNGAAAHALELDDDHRVAVLHPGAVVVPAAFAAAEAAGASGRDFLLGVLAGYEVDCRVGDVFQGTLFQHGFHPTAVCGVFGAAAAAASIARLDEARFTNALAIAGTQAAGLTEWRTDGSWIKRLHPGRSAQSGVLAAALAHEGFTGPATIFEGRSGFLAAFSHGERIDEAALTRRLGEEFRTLGTAIKPYPCCRFAHGAIDLARDAHHAGIRASAIGEVEVRLYRTDVLTYHHRPKNAVDAQFNVPYLVALALANGSVELGDLTPAAVRRESILRLADRIRVVEDEGYTAEYPERYFTSLEVRLEDGQIHRGLSDCPSGDPEAARYRSDPGLLHRETVEKARRLLAECGFGERGDALVEAVAGLDAAPDLSRLVEILGPGPGA